MFETINVIIVGAFLVAVGGFSLYTKQRINIENLEWAAKWVRSAVMGVEQMHKDVKGFAKYDLVVKFLESVGVKLPRKQLEILIEKAVFEMNQNKA